MRLQAKRTPDPSFSPWSKSPFPFCIATQPLCSTLPLPDHSNVNSPGESWETRHNQSNDTLCCPSSCPELVRCTNSTGPSVVASPLIRHECTRPASCLVHSSGPSQLQPRICLSPSRLRQTRLTPLPTPRSTKASHRGDDVPFFVGSGLDPTVSRESRTKGSREEGITSQPDRHPVATRNPTRNRNRNRPRPAHDATLERRDRPSLARTFKLASPIGTTESRQRDQSYLTIRSSAAYGASEHHGVR